MDFIANASMSKIYIRLNKNILELLLRSAN